ncbi:unnamed protein product [Tuber aestivum]|uniref:Uncharacterized protein n=1 Tax=Tuber aestivum TaxID=59557 RepID=A0A292PT26_9PEZI|nr:unnamed protein product [Tuber aestivum]
MTYKTYFRRGRDTRFSDFGRVGCGKWTRSSPDRVHDEARYLHDQVDRDVKWEWSEGGLAASESELYRLGILYDQEVESVEEVEVTSSAGTEVGSRSEVSDDWSVLDDGESVIGDWDFVSESG